MYNTLVLLANFIYMKKLHLLSSLMFLTLLLSGSAFAETVPSLDNKISNLKQKISDIKENVLIEKNAIQLKSNEVKNNLKEKLSSTTARLIEKKQELRTAAEIRVGKKLDEKKNNIADAFEKSIQNIKDLVSRVESRIIKMESSSINASSSRVLLDIAKTKLSIAETSLTDLELLLAQDIPTATSTKNDSRKITLQNIKKLSEKTKSEIKIAHKAIVDVVNSLKPGQFKEKNSTSTKEKSSTSSDSEKIINN